MLAAGSGRPTVFAPVAHRGQSPPLLGGSSAMVVAITLAGNQLPTDAGRAAGCHRRPVTDLVSYAVGVAPRWAMRSGFIA